MPATEPSLSEGNKNDASVESNEASPITYHRSGFCTYYLYSLCKPWLEPTTTTTTVDSASSAGGSAAGGVEVVVDGTFDRLMLLGSDEGTSIADGATNATESDGTTVSTSPSTEASSVCAASSAKGFHTGATSTLTNVACAGTGAIGPVASVTAIAGNGTGPGAGVSYGTIPPVIELFHKATVTFHLPGSIGYPLILVGPGTGVAPFMGFLEHRKQLEKHRRHAIAQIGTCCGTWRGNFEFDDEDLPGECNEVDSYIESIPPGSVHLFFGCRNSSDFLFQKELEAYATEGTLTVLDVAMSRVSTDKKEYVMDKLRARGKELYELLVKQEAYIYICGDGNYMAKDVQATFISIFQQYGNTTEAEASEWLQMLKLRRRYLLDVWG